MGACNLLEAIIVSRSSCCLNSSLKKNAFRPFCTLFAFLASLSAGCSIGQGVNLELKEILEQKINALDLLNPGRGTTDYPGNSIEDVAKGYAMLLKAEVIRSQANNQDKISELGLNAANYLLENSDARADGFPGWGVPVAWDPYGDGSFNPAHTKYTISTAIVIDSLLDWLEFDSTAPEAKIMQVSSEALGPYLDQKIYSPSGLFPYSLELVDRKFDTFNPAAYLAGVMQRFSLLIDDPLLKRSLQSAADTTIQVHIDHHKLTNSGSWFWNYSISENVPNDLAHAGYIIYGIDNYVKNSGNLSGSINLSMVKSHLFDFVGQDSVTPQAIAWPGFTSNLVNTPARSYGLGFALYLSCGSDSMSNKKMSQSFLESVDSYNKEGGFSKYPLNSKLSMLSIAEYNAYMILGLAQCQKMHSSSRN